MNGSGDRIIFEVYILFYFKIHSMKISALSIIFSLSLSLLSCTPPPIEEGCQNEVEELIKEEVNKECHFEGVEKSLIIQIF